MSDSRGRFFFQSFGGTNGILVFDSTGKFMRRFGRSGQGPGEFGGSGFSFTVAGGDTILVCGARQCQVFSPDLTHVRSFATMPSSITLGMEVLDGGDLVLRMRSPDSLLSRNPVHRVTMSGQLRASFGSRIPIERSCVLCVTNGGMGVAYDRRNVWIASAGKYELERWSAAGEFQQRVTVAGSSWYVPWSPLVAGVTPMSAIRSISEDQNGVLFLFGEEAVVADGAAVLPPGVRMSARDLASQAPRNVKRTPHIEAVDVRGGRVLATLSVPGMVYSTFGGRYITTVRQGPGSVRYIDVWRVVLRRSPYE